MILLKNVTKSYQSQHNSIQVLDNITLEIKQNSFIALLGRSGSGKTTLMNILGGLDTIDSGEYYLDNHKIHNCSISQLATIRNQYIGFIFQQFHLLPQFTAVENVALPLFYRGIDTHHRLIKAAEILALLGLADRLYHKPQELSGGQQQRVAIARALITDPKVILADEPTGNLDSKAGEYIMQVFKDLHTEGKTIIVITHDQHIANLTKQQILLVDGKIQ
jgi:putative ABC transport system ATP-binding protein